MFIDPPYVSAEKHYRFGSKTIDYAALLNGAGGVLASNRLRKRRSDLASVSAVARNSSKRWRWIQSKSRAIYEQSLTCLTSPSRSRSPTSNVSFPTTPHAPSTWKLSVPRELHLSTLQRDVSPDASRLALTSSGVVLAARRRAHSWHDDADSHTPLSVWFWRLPPDLDDAGMSAVQFQRQLGLRGTRPRSILHKLRSACPPEETASAKLPCEVDETYVSGKTRGEERGVHHGIIVASASRYVPVSLRIIGGRSPSRRTLRRRSASSSSRTVAGRALSISWTTLEEARCRDRHWQATPSQGEASTTLPSQSASAKWQRSTCPSFTSSSTPQVFDS